MAYHNEAGNRNLLEKLKEEADPAAHEVISSVDSLEEDIDLALFDEEPKTEREVTKKVKGARFLLERANKIGNVEKLKKEADPAAFEVISNVDSLEEDIDLALYDKEPKSQREVTKKVKGARFLLDLNGSDLDFPVFPIRNAYRAWGRGFQCPVCGMRFNSRGAQRSHARHCHPHPSVNLCF